MSQTLLDASMITARTLPASVMTDSNKGSVQRYAVMSGTDTYTGSLSPAPLAYTSGMSVILSFTNANTGAATFNLNSLGAVAAQKNGVALAAGDIPGSSKIEWVHDGSVFQMVGSASSGGSSGGNPIQAQVFS